VKDDIIYDIMKKAEWGMLGACLIVPLAMVVRPLIWHPGEESGDMLAPVAAPAPPGEALAATALQFSRDGSRVLAAVELARLDDATNAWHIRRDRMRVYDAAGGREVWALPARPLSRALPLPDFKTVLSCWGAWEIKRFDIHSFRQLPPIEVSSGYIGSFELSPDHRLLAIGMTAGVEIRDARTYKILRRYDHGAQGTRVQFGPGGREILCRWGSMKPHCISVATARQVRWPRWVYRLKGAWAASRDGSRLAIVNGQSIEIWKTPGRADGGVKLKTLRSKLRSIRTLQFSPDGRRLAAGGVSAQNGPVETFDL
jgi:WD40 repeat protein